MYPGVELRLLRYVVAIAEELNFSRAAKRLNVSQPSLSKQIRTLEAELGTKLFERTKRQVRLTPAGEAFVVEARQCLLFNERAASAAKRAHCAPSFRLGYTAFVDLRRIGRIRTASPADFGGISIELVSCYAGNPVEQIQVGELEAGLVLLPLGNPQLSVEWLWTEELYAVLPARHRLAKARKLRLQDLRSIPFISIGGKLYPALDAHVMNCCAGHGLHPDRVQDVTTFAEAAAIVADGLGFTFGRCWPERLANKDIAFKRIEGIPLALETGIIYNTVARCEIVEKLVALLQPECVKRGPSRELRLKEPSQMAA